MPRRLPVVLSPLVGFGAKLVDRILCVAGAVLFCQFPEFVQQYLQRLGGSLDEARRQLEKFKEAATQSGLSLSDFITRTAHNSDQAVARLGQVMQDAVSRVEQLASAEQALRQASVFTRPLAFLRHLDVSIARSTWEVYRPAIPTTPESLIYALLGVVVMLGLYQLLILGPLSLYRARKARNLPPGNQSPPEVPPK